jgi:hypothetical protein
MMQVVVQSAAVLGRMIATGQDSRGSKRMQVETGPDQGRTLKAAAVTQDMI